MVDRVESLTIHLASPALGSAEEQDVGDFVFRQALVDPERGKQRDLFEVDSKKVLQVVADFHSGWFAAFAAQVALDASKCLARHQGAEDTAHGGLHLVNMGVVVGVDAGSPNGLTSRVVGGGLDALIHPSLLALHQASLECREGRSS